MKKLILSSLVSLFTCSLIFAQDIIITQEGETIQAKVLEISDNEVKYKISSELDGATYIVKKSDIFMITYESGRTDVFKSALSNKELPAEGITKGMKYQDIKDIYHYKNYYREYGDRRFPGWSGVASFFITGLGECINGEWGRGLGKTALGILCNTIYTTNLYSDYPDNSIALISSLARCGINIWSIVDASRIAKVKNMYERDLRKLYSFEVELRPSINYAPVGNSTQLVPGVSLAINF